MGTLDTAIGVSGLAALAQTFSFCGGLDVDRHRRSACGAKNENRSVGTPYP